MSENYSCTIKFTTSKTEKLIREQREKCRIFCHADVSQHASGNTKEQQAILYLRKNKIYNIIEFLIGNLLLRRPYDPYEYLGQLLDKYILSRSGLVDSPFPFPYEE